MNVRRALRGPAATAALLLATACSLPSDATSDPANVVGSWAFSGEQSAPAASLEGTLTITAQDGDLVSGTLSWVQEDAVGNTILDGGPITGRVIGTTEIDFDLLRPGGSRRHVGQLHDGTMDGTWLQPAAGLSGTFSATRVSP